MSQEFWGFIKDPIYGYIRLTDVERRVIDTPAVQRLRRVRQLAGAEFVYPAANHTRFEHVLGTMYLAGVVSDSLPAQLTAAEKQKVRLAALLHDVGHAPFSHLFEPLLLKYMGRNHEEASEWLISESSLADTLKSEGFDAKAVSRLAVGRPAGQDKGFLGQIISSSFDVDKMDFVVRDSYHTGAGYGSVDVFRLIYTMDVLDGNLAVDATALPALESLILARLESFKAIYFHRACRAVQMMLLKALDEAEEDLGILHANTPEEYLEWDDYEVWSTLRHNPTSRGIMKQIAERKLLKCAYERTFYAKDEPPANTITKEEVRRRLEEEIAAEAKIPAADVGIDAPTLPTVPYHYAMDLGRLDIPIFSRTRSGEKISQKITQLSKVLDDLRVFMNIVRVYTKEQYRTQVSDAAAHVFGEPPPPSNTLPY